MATGMLHGEACKLRYDASADRWRYDRSDRAPVTRAELLAAIGAGDIIHFFGLPVGYGERVGGDRNQNGILDGDEILPDLRAEAVGGQVKIGWDDLSTGWTLEQAGSDLRGWSPLTLPREEDGNGVSVRDPENDESKYYRLRRTW